MKQSIIFLLACLLLQSCATIFAGNESRIRVKRGEPDSCQVYYNGEFKGSTPEAFSVYKGKRNGSVGTIEIKKSGYQTQAVQLRRRPMIGWLIVDILAGAWPLIIDFATGSIYKPTPQAIDYHLQKSQ